MKLCFCDGCQQKAVTLHQPATGACQATAHLLLLPQYDLLLASKTLPTLMMLHDIPVCLLLTTFFLPPQVCFSPIFYLCFITASAILKGTSLLRLELKGTSRVLGTGKKIVICGKHFVIKTNKSTIEAVSISNDISHSLSCVLHSFLHFTLTSLKCL